MIEKRLFETLPDGRKVHCWRLSSSDGAGLTVMDLGATILSLEVPDRDGALANVVLGYDRAETYLDDPHYLGAVIGRFANRIAGGHFTIDGTEHHLAVYDPPNALHGGVTGFDKRLWHGNARTTDDGESVCFTLVSEDGDQGYPGTLKASVRYTWTQDHRLLVDYTAATDAPTPFNPTQHSYWNLSGASSPDVLDHLLTIAAGCYLPVDTNLIPTGEFASVSASPFDFREARPIGRDIEATHPQLEIGSGYDHCFVLDGSGFRQAATLADLASGRRMTVHTDMPGMQLYSGNFLGPVANGRGEETFRRHSAVALETQFFPDSPNQPHFPDATLRPGERFASRTVHAFDVIGK